VAVLGVSLIALGEPVGEEMSRRMFEHILQYGEPAVRRAVPLALALSNLSHPDVYAVDTLSKLSHDASPAVAQGAILGLGLVAAVCLLCLCVCVRGCFDDYLNVLCRSRARTMHVLPGCCAPWPATIIKNQHICLPFALLKA